MLGEAVFFIEGHRILGDEQLISARKRRMRHKRLQHPCAQPLLLIIRRHDEIADVGVHRVIGDGPNEANGLTGQGQHQTSGVRQRLRNLLHGSLRRPVGALQQRSDGGHIESVRFIS